MFLGKIVAVLLSLKKLQGWPCCCCCNLFLMLTQSYILGWCGMKMQTNMRTGRWRKSPFFWN